MSTQKAFVEKQRAALEAGDVEEALRLLSELEDRMEKAKVWGWLRSNEPKSYEQLISKVGYAAEGLAQSGRIELGQLARVFTWCKDHNIELAALGLPKHLFKYREAASKLNLIVTSQAEEANVKADLLAEIETIKSHVNRAQTRAWARTPRSET